MGHVRWLAAVSGFLAVLAPCFGQSIVDIGGDPAEWEYYIPGQPVVLNVGGVLVWRREVATPPTYQDRLMTDNADAVGSPSVILETGQAVGNQVGEDWVSIRGPLVTDDAEVVWFNGATTTLEGMGQVEPDGAPDLLFPQTGYVGFVAAQPDFALYFKQTGSLQGQDSLFRLNADGSSSLLIEYDDEEDYPSPVHGTGAVNVVGEVVGVVDHGTYETLRYFPGNLSGVEDVVDSRGPLPGMSGKYLEAIHWPTLDDADNTYPLIAFAGPVRVTTTQALVHSFSIWANTGEDFEFRCLIKAGDAAPGFPSGAVFVDLVEEWASEERLGLSLNRSGQIAIAATVENSSVSLGSGVFVIDATNATASLRVATGTQAAGLPVGYEYESVTRAWIMDNGNVVFGGTASLDPESDLKVNGIWVVDPYGEASLIFLYGLKGGDPFFLGEHGCFRPGNAKVVWEQGGRADGRRRAILEDGRTFIRVDLVAGAGYSFAGTEAVILGEPHTPENPMADVTCDFNCDGNIDQGDVSDLVNAIAGGPSPCCKDPDITGDGNADGDDVTELVNRIAGSGC